MWEELPQNLYERPDDTKLSSASLPVESEDNTQAARDIYRQLRYIATFPNYSIELNNVAGLGAIISYESGDVRREKMLFTQYDPASPHGVCLIQEGFTPEEVQDGILRLMREYRSVPHEPIREAETISIHLSSSGIKARRSTETHAEIPYTLSPEELNLVNVISYLSLAPEKIQALFGSYTGFQSLLVKIGEIGGKTSQLPGINTTITSNRLVLYAGGLANYMHALETNTNGEQQRLTAFRGYIGRYQQALVTSYQLPAPQAT